jgi:hypothetical protein
MGWGIQQVDKDDFSKGVIVVYNEQQGGTFEAFSGCLDRRDQSGWLSVGECTGELTARNVTMGPRSIQLLTALSATCCTWILTTRHLLHLDPNHQGCSPNGST